MLQNLISMKNLVVLFTLLFACGTGIKAQISANIFKIVSAQQLLAINFINNIRFPTQEFTISSNTNSSTAKTTIGNNIETISGIQFKYAMMLDVEVETLSDPRLLRFIEEWYGTRYRMGGTTKKGVDCSAFSGTLLSSIYSFSLPRTAREQYKICERVKKDELLAGDLVFFNTRGGVSHVGVYLANNRFVHSSSSNGVIISNLDDNYYAKKFIGGGRINQ